MTDVTLAAIILGTSFLAGCIHLAYVIEKLAEGKHNTYSFDQSVIDTINALFQKAQP